MRFSFVHSVHVHFLGCFLWMIISKVLATRHLNKLLMCYKFLVPFILLTIVWFFVFYRCWCVKQLIVCCRGTWWPFSPKKCWSLWSLHQYMETGCRYEHVQKKCRYLWDLWVVFIILLVSLCISIILLLVWVP